jgi:hypothetical protein
MHVYKDDVLRIFPSLALTVYGTALRRTTVLINLDFMGGIHAKRGR